MSICVFCVTMCVRNSGKKEGRKREEGRKEYTAPPESDTTHQTIDTHIICIHLYFMIYLSYIFDSFRCFSIHIIFQNIFICFLLRHIVFHYVIKYFKIFAFLQYLH